ncbi:protein YebF [Serratia rhizosphaerae]|uniref:protein YebF n=1 Tax=Serratia sp. JUb9 TaxID=2724469 RepID=UPI00164E3DCF|nr:protein YebF [Serratia sp. JUb9]MBU3894244.1 hypothetical protein [Serratia rubidaea]QNK34385.1 hypothetical protein HF675_10275 [Serratia sp. JUb9]
MRATGLGLATVLAVILGFTGSAQAQQHEQRTAKVGLCAGLQAADVAAQVKRDFLQNRITRWASDKKLLGTATPVAWVSPDAVSGEDDLWQVPLTVRGSKADKTYRVTLNCKTGDIAYSEPQ